MEANSPIPTHLEVSVRCYGLQDIRKIKQTTSIPVELPPRELPDKPIDAANKEAMLAQAYKKLDEREALIRDQRDEIYAAISKAVPFEIFEKLSKLENENSD